MKMERKRPRADMDGEKANFLQEMLSLKGKLPNKTLIAIRYNMFRGKVKRNVII